jgi:transcriptional regulator
MYAHPSHRELDTAQILTLVDTASFGLLVTNGVGAPMATHLPMLLDVREGGLPRLFGHMARANAHWRAASGQRALAVFAGAAGYISPAWYGQEPDVPTWNYAAAHLEGVFRLVEDPGELRALLTETVERFEARSGSGWSLSGVPRATLEGFQAAVAAFTIEVEMISGVTKHSQDKTAAEQASVIARLTTRASPGDAALAAEMAATHRRRGDLL